MKVMSKFKMFGLTILVSFLLGCVIYNVSKDTSLKDNVIEVNGTKQVMPIEIDSDYEVVDAKLDEYEITISLLDKNSGEIYESTLPSEDLEDFVCNIQYYSYKGANKRYDCSTEDKIVESMIKEVGLQTIEVINEGY